MVVMNTFLLLRYSPFAVEIYVPDHNDAAELAKRLYVKVSIVWRSWRLRQKEAQFHVLTVVQ